MSSWDIGILYVLKITGLGTLAAVAVVWIDHFAIRQRRKVKRAFHELLRANIEGVQKRDKILRLLRKCRQECTFDAGSVLPAQVDEVLEEEAHRIKTG